MEKCTKCGHVQETGKFCGNCGAAFKEEEMSQQNGPANVETQQPVNNTNSNEKMEKLKNESSQYMNHFVEQLKNPSENFFDAAANFKQHIISAVVYLVLFAITVYSLLTKMGYEAVDFYYMELPSKSSLVLKASLAVLLMMGIGILATFIVNKFFGPELTFKEVVSQCSAFFAIPIILQIISILAILIEAMGTGFIFLIISLLIVALMVPIFVVSKLLNKQTQKIDGFYALLTSVAVIVILNIFCYRFLVMSIVSSVF